MGGLREESFGGSGERERGIKEVEKAMKTGSVTKKKGKKIDDLYRCQPHPGLQG